MPALALILFFLATHAALAERYLTIDEARKILFPDADRFEARTLLFTPAQIKALEKRLGRRVPNRGQRFWLAYQGETLLGLAVFDQVFGKHELIDYAVALNPSGAVGSIEILEYRESYGGEIRQAKWRAQFHGKRAKDRLLLNDTIYNISGATISCRNVTDGVRRILATYELIIAPELAPGLPK